MKSRLSGLVLAAVALVALLIAPSSPALAAEAPNPQLAKAKAAFAPVPDQCLLLRQLNPDEQKYRATHNAPWTYTSAVYGTNWFNVKCGSQMFDVARGSEAMVDLTASAELDCQAPNSPNPTNGWCEARHWVTNTNVLPNNTDRGDTFAWDSSNGGAFDWQANTLDQSGRSSCPLTSPTACTFHVKLQARLQNGATSLWVDDLSDRVDVSPGPVTVTTVVNP